MNVGIKNVVPKSRFGRTALNLLTIELDDVINKYQGYKNTEIHQSDEQEEGQRTLIIAAQVLSLLEFHWVPFEN